MSKVKVVHESRRGAGAPERAPASSLTWMPAPSASGRPPAPVSSCADATSASTRYASQVRTADDEGRKAQADGNVLMKALDAGR